MEAISRPDGMGPNQGPGREVEVDRKCWGVIRGLSEKLPCVCVGGGGAYGPEPPPPPPVPAPLYYILIALVNISMLRCHFSIHAFHFYLRGVSEDILLNSRSYKYTMLKIHDIVQSYIII